MAKTATGKRVRWLSQLTFAGETQTVLAWLKLLKDIGMGWMAITAFLQDHGIANISYATCRKRLSGHAEKGDKLILSDLEPLSPEIVNLIDVAYWERAGAERFGQGAPADEFIAKTHDATAANDGERKFSLESEDRKSAEELIREMGLNADEWIVVSFEARLKDVVAKNELKDLEADEGRWTGSVSTAPEVKQLWAYVLKIKPAPKQAEIKIVRVTLPETPLVVDHTPMDSIRTMLLISDPQIGFNGDESYHDRNVLDIALSIAYSHQYDYVVWTGDVLDFTHFGHFKGHTEARDTQRAIYEAAYWLGLFRKAQPNAIFDLIEGNHDVRLRGDIRKSLNGADKLCSAKSPGTQVMGLVNLLGLDDMRINLHDGWPNNDWWYGPYLRVLHGEHYSATPGGTIAAILKDASENTVAGHSHIAEHGHKNVQEAHGPRPVTAVSLPCCCKVDGTTPGKAANPNWQQGVATLTFDLESRLFDYHPIIVRNGIALYGSLPIRGCGSDHRREIEEMYKGEW